MSEIEKLIEDLTKDKAKHCHVGFEKLVDKAISILKTLQQPQSNAELVEELREMNEYFGQSSRTHPVLIRAIAALDRPEKFDVLEAIEKGGSAHYGDIGFYIKLNELNEICEYTKDDKTIYRKIPAGHLVGKEWVPYDPEPAPSEILEKARESVGLITGDIVPNDLKAVSAALDCLEKFLSE